MTFAPWQSQFTFSVVYTELNNPLFPFGYFSHHSKITPQNTAVLRGPRYDVPYKSLHRERGRQSALAYCHRALFIPLGRRRNKQHSSAPLYFPSWLGTHLARALHAQCSLLNSRSSCSRPNQLSYGVNHVSSKTVLRLSTVTPASGYCPLTVVPSPSISQ